MLLKVSVNRHKKAYGAGPCCFFDVGRHPRQSTLLLRPWQAFDSPAHAGPSMWTRMTSPCCCFFVGSYCETAFVG